MTDSIFLGPSGLAGVAVSSLAGVAVTSRAGVADADWWRDAVIYEIYVRSFADADGDGVGDLQGVRGRLPYLTELGVDAIWLTPFYPSPMADGGYDVSDHRGVDPLFGTMDDARALIADVHAAGLRIIIDLVPNHTSDRHEWFAQAVRNECGARDRYIVRKGRGDGPPNDWESVFGGPAWTRLPDGSWYLHLFAPEQPDLNWDNPEVLAEFTRILRFWLDLGVDGFRIDVAHGMVKAPGLPDVGYEDQIRLLGSDALPYFDQDGVHEIHRAFRRVLDEYPGRRIGVAEAWAPDQHRLARYVRPGELHQAFNFHYLTAGWDAATLREVIGESIAAMGAVGAPATWVLSNHDVRRHVTRFGEGPAGVRRARAAAMLMLALPGSAYIYQGDELGLPEALGLPEEVLTDPQRFREAAEGRDGCRVPMPWKGTEPPFGFSPPGSAPSWLPVPHEWRQLTVEAQLDDPSSMLGLYHAALRIRRERLGHAGWARIHAPEGVLAFARGAGFACTVNVTGESIEIDRPGSPILASADPEGRGATVRLAPDSAVWWET